MGLVWATLVLSTISVAMEIGRGMLMLIRMTEVKMDSGRELGKIGQFPDSPTLAESEKTTMVETIEVTIIGEKREE